MIRNKQECHKCNKHISNSNFDKHVTNCKGKNKTPDLSELQQLDNGNYQCPHCDVNFSKKGIRYHIWKQHTKEGKDFNPYKEGRKAWNKGLTKETNNSVARIAKTLSENYSGENASFYGKKHKPETIQKLKQNSGGYRKGSGRGKKGWYKGFWCDSSWELAFVIYNLEHNVHFERNTQGFNYNFNGKTLKYYPDFILKDGSYVEIKGYDTEQTLAKYDCFPHQLAVLKKKDLKPIISYVEEKYGKDFIRLYSEEE